MFLREIQNLGPSYSGTRKLDIKTVNSLRYSVPLFALSEVLHTSKRLLLQYSQKIKKYMLSSSD